MSYQERNIAPSNLARAVLAKKAIALRGGEEGANPVACDLVVVAAGVGLARSVGGLGEFVQGVLNRRRSLCRLLDVGAVDTRNVTETAETAPSTETETGRLLSLGVTGVVKRRLRRRGGANLSEAVVEIDLGLIVILVCVGAARCGCIIKVASANSFFLQAIKSVTERLSRGVRGGLAVGLFVSTVLKVAGLKRALRENLLEARVRRRTDLRAARKRVPRMTIVATDSVIELFSQLSCGLGDPIAARKALADKVRKAIEREVRKEGVACIDRAFGVPIVVLRFIGGTLKRVADSHRNVHNRGLIGIRYPVKELVLRLLEDLLKFGLRRKEYFVGYRHH